MGSSSQTRTAGREQLVGVLVPAPGHGRPLPVPAPVPVLPPRPARWGAGARSRLIDIARVDGSGRVSARHLFRALGWEPGHRVGLDVVDGVLRVASAADGVRVIGGRGELGLPRAARRMCGIEPGPPVLVVACPGDGVLLVYPVGVVADLLATRYAWPGPAAGGGDGG